MYWHELTLEQRITVCKSGMIVQQFLDTYQVPSWCDDPDMIDPVFGCWSLFSNNSVTESFCKDCEEYKNVEENSFA